METAWVFNIVITLCIAALLKSLHDFFFPKSKLPPGPISVPFLGSLLMLLKSSSDLEPILRKLHAKYGPIVTLQIGSRRTIYVSDNSLAHKSLIQTGSLLASRPGLLPIYGASSGTPLTTSLSPYGPTWRLLRRNLTSEILQPSRLGNYSQARRWVLGILTSRLRARSDSGEAVLVVDHFRYSMFCLLVLMCFGDKLDEKQIEEIETAQRKVLLNIDRFSILNFWPAVGKVLFRRRWEELSQLRKSKGDILLHYIRARQQQLKQEIKFSPSKNSAVLAYIDTLLDLQLPEAGRKLNEGEMISLCSEFIDAGTDTTASVLQWIMANLVKHPHIQAKLFEEINGVVAVGKEMVEEEDLQRMPYLKAVVLEGLRRHPPSHFLEAHSASQDISLEGYIIPKKACLNVMLPEINWNPKIWKEPMEFNPERFLNREGDIDDEALDITGSREIKMMTFGAGRRMCPGFVLAILNLEYFVANLVWSFEWKGVEGENVDMSEKQEFGVVMKNPLQAILSPRGRRPN